MACCPRGGRPSPHIHLTRASPWGAKCTEKAQSPKPAPNTDKSPLRLMGHDAESQSTDELLIFNILV